MRDARRSRIPVRDGVAGWRRRSTCPDDAAGPQPCLLEALPYRKDDLTSSYAASYRTPARRVRVRRVPASTCAAPGRRRATRPTSTRRPSSATCPTSIAWLAAQDWCDGQVGMCGTSYSGFNSLQIACERPPALKAICAIYATDDRWTDDVHWRGGALRLVDLVDYCHYMTPMCVLPPVPAVWGDGLARRVAAAAGDQRAVGADLAAREPARRLLGPRVGAARRDDAGYERIDVPGDDRGRLGRRLPQQLVPHRRRARRGTAYPHRLLAGPWAHADPATAMPGPRIDFDAELAAWFDHWLRGTRRRTQDRLRRLRPRVDAARARPRPARGPLGDAAVGAAGRPRRRSTSTAPATLDGRARRRHRRLDRLRRPPAVGAVRRPAARRRALADLGGRAAAGRRSSATRCSGPGSGRPSRRRRCR